MADRSWAMTAPGASPRHSGQADPPRDPSLQLSGKPKVFEYLFLHRDGKVRNGVFQEDQLEHVTERFSGGPLVIFMDRVMELAPDLSRDETTEAELKKKSLRKKIEKTFHMDEFFLTESAYESNGFFRCHSHGKDAWACRLLVKELSKAPYAKELNAAKVELFRCIVGDELDDDTQISDIAAVEYPSDQEMVIENFVKDIPQGSVESVKRLLRSAIIAEECERKDLLAAFKRTQIKIQTWKTQEPAILESLKKDKRLKLFHLLTEYALQGLHHKDCLLDQPKSLSEELNKKTDEPPSHNDRLMPPMPVRASTMAFPGQLEHRPSQQQQGALIADMRNWGNQMQLPGSTKPGLNGHTSNVSLGRLQPSRTGTAGVAKTIDEERGGQTPGPGNGGAPPDPATNQQRPTAKLEKQLQVNYTYHWLFLSFWAVTLHTHNATLPVLLCFDDTRCIRFKNMIREKLESSAVYSGKSTIMLSILLEEILQIFDEALWGFRKPVRNFEKRREEHLKDQHDVKSGYQIHFDIRELSRHLIHSQETLGAAQTVIESIAYIMSPVDTQLSSTPDLVRFSLTFVKNLKLRAGAFVDRINNETALAYDIMTFKQLLNTQTLLQESKNDGKEINKALALISIFFLPGTYFSGIFGIDYFDGNSNVIYIWTGLTLFTTTILMIAPFWWPYLRKILPSRVFFLGELMASK